jgi:hypothetical protein
VSSVSRAMPRFMSSDRVGEAERSFAVQASCCCTRRYAEKKNDKRAFFK